MLWTLLGGRTVPADCCPGPSQLCPQCQPAPRSLSFVRQPSGQPGSPRLLAFAPEGGQAGASPPTPLSALRPETFLPGHVPPQGPMWHWQAQPKAQASRREDVLGLPLPPGWRGHRRWPLGSPRCPGSCWWGWRREQGGSCRSAGLLPGSEPVAWTPVPSSRLVQAQEPGPGRCPQTASSLGSQTLRCPLRAKEVLLLP